MSDRGCVVVLRLTGDPSVEGKWYGAPSGWTGQAMTLESISSAEQLTMVCTGNLEWYGDACAEVWVPEDKLDLWRAEHDVEEER